MPHIVFWHSYAFQEYAHMVNEIPVFESMEYNICCEIIILKFQVTQAPFVCIL